MGTSVCSKDAAVPLAIPVDLQSSKLEVVTSPIFYSVIAWLESVRSSHAIGMCIQSFKPQILSGCPWPKDHQQWSARIPNGQPTGPTRWPRSWVLLTPVMGHGFPMLSEGFYGELELNNLNTRWCFYNGMLKPGNERNRSLFRVELLTSSLVESVSTRDWALPQPP